MKKILVVMLLLTAYGLAQNGTNGTLTVANAGCVSGSCVSLHFDSPEVGSSTIQLSAVFTATVQFEASSDGGTTFVAINGTPLNGTTGVSSATTANTWQFNVAGMTDIRARCSAFTSAPNVVIRSSKAMAKAGGGTSLPALSDNGTKVTSTEVLVLPAGATGSGNGALQIGGANNSELWSPSANNLRLFSGAGDRINLGAQGIQVNSGAAAPSDGYCFAATVGTCDTAIRSDATSSVIIGKVPSATPAANTLTIGASSRGGTDTDVGGAVGTTHAGIGTGAGVPAAFNIQGSAVGASGSAAQTQVLSTGNRWYKALSNNTATTVANVTDASNTAAVAIIHYGIEIFDGTNLQWETGLAMCGVNNKAGVFAQNTCTKSGNAQGLGSGTLTVTWTITGANPALLQVNSNSSLTTTTNRLFYNIENLSNQAVTEQ